MKQHPSNHPGGGAEKQPGAGLVAEDERGAGRASADARARKVEREDPVSYTDRFLNLFLCCATEINRRNLWLRIFEYLTFHNGETLMRMRGLHQYARATKGSARVVGKIGEGSSEAARRGEEDSKTKIVHVSSTAARVSDTTTPNTENRTTANNENRKGKATRRSKSARRRAGAMHTFVRSI